MKHPSGSGRRPLHISLRMALTAPFVLLTVLAVALTGFLAFENGLYSVNHLVGQLQQEIANQTQQALKSQLSTPHLVNRINHDLWQIGDMDLDDATHLQRHFAVQLQQFPIVNQILFHPVEGPLTWVSRTPLQPGSTLEPPIQGLDGRDGEAIAHHPPFWSLTAATQGNSLSIYATHPVYEETTQTLRGTFSAGVDLAQASQMLQRIMADHAGEAFIIERNGFLLARSDQGPIVINAHQRVTLPNSESPLLQAVGRYLNQQGHNLAEIQQSQQFEVRSPFTTTTTPGRYVAQITPLQDEYGLDWLMVTLLPESRLLTQIHHNTLETLQLCLVALLSTLALGTITAHYLARPIVQMNRAALAIAHHGLDQRLPENWVVKELADLARSLNRMASQLRESLNRMNLALQASEEKFAKIFHASPDPIRITTFAEGRFLDVNESFLQFTGYRREEVIGVTSTELDIWINPGEQARFRQALVHGPVRGQELHYRTKDGEIRTWLFSAEMIELDGTLCILGVSRDITDRKQAELALKDNQEQLNSILNSLDSAVWSVSCADYRLLYLSPAIQDIYGCSPLEFIEHPRRWSEMVHPDDRDYVQQGTQLLYATGMKDQEYRIVRLDGAVRWVRTRARLIRDRLGNSLRIDGMTSDISDRKQAEAALRASLREKDVLLSEIHHRVKNNLQVISSLLDIQALRIAHGEAQQVLEDSRSRVYSMALVHEHLYRSQSFAQVNFAEYAYELASYLLSTYQQPDIEIQLQIDIDPRVSISLDQAIPCGLLTNELITNSIKYGFSQRKKGALYIALKSEEKHFLCLTVGNDDDTLPSGFELDQHFHSMGLQLVVTLVEQLEGTIAFERAPNTLFHITFPSSPDT